MSRLVLKNLTKIYRKEIVAVKDFSLEINENEFVVILGKSGSGKTSLIRMIAGLEEVTAGEIYLDEVLLNDLDPSKRQVALVSQNFALYPQMSAYQNIALPLKYQTIIDDVYDRAGQLVLTIDQEKIASLKKEYKEKKQDGVSKEELALIKKNLQIAKKTKVVPLKKKRHYTKNEIERMVKEVSHFLNITPFLHRRAMNLSGGEKQRVALAKAILKKPKIFLMDEPLSSLDLSLRHQARQLILDAHQKYQATTLFITHDYEEALLMGDRIVLLDQGQIVQVGTPKELYHHPLSLFAAAFIGSPPINLIHLILTDDHLLLNDDEQTPFLKLSSPLKKRLSLCPKGTKIIMGIRPDALNDQKEDDEQTRQLSGIIDQVKIFGNVSYCYANIMKKRFLFKPSPKSEHQQGDNILLYFNEDDLHFFAQNDGRRIA